VDLRTFSTLGSGRGRSQSPRIGFNFDRRIGGRREGTHGTLASFTDTTESMRVRVDVLLVIIHIESPSSKVENRNASFANELLVEAVRDGSSRMFVDYSESVIYDQSLNTGL